MIREVENIGANVTSTATREQMSYSIDALKTHVAEAVEVLADSVLNPRLEASRGGSRGRAPPPA